MRFWQMSTLGFVASLARGCASVVNGTTEPIYLTSLPENGANCEVSNARGSWPVTTPGTVVVKKSDSVLVVHCAKAGRRDAKEYFASKLSTSALVGAFLPYAGLVSAAVDGSSGASGEYPSAITITMKILDDAGQGATANPASQAVNPQSPPEGVP